MRDFPPATSFGAPLALPGPGQVMAAAAGSVPSLPPNAATAADHSPVVAAEALRRALLRRQLLALLGHEPAGHPTTS